MIHSWVACSETCLSFLEDIVSINKIIQAGVKNGGKQFTEAA